MPIELNADSFEIKNYELTPQGYLKCWLVGGIADKVLVYDGGRKEVINEDALFNETSINSAVGKPIVLNHPPRAITSKNYKQYSHGTILQEYAKDADTKALILAGIIHDAEMVNGIMTGKYKYVSAGYKADKTPNNDGILDQSNRDYDHFGVLDEQHIPRAGEESKIVTLSEFSENSQDGIEDNKNAGENVLPQPAPPASTSQITNEDMTKEIDERVDLLLEWKPILEKHSKAASSNMDSKTIKRNVLSIYYPEKTMNLITDANIDGVWLGFLTTANINVDAGDLNQSPLFNYQPTPPASTNKQPINFDAAVDTELDKFVKQMEGKV